MLVLLVCFKFCFLLNSASIFMEADLVARIGTRINVSNWFFANNVKKLCLYLSLYFSFYFVRLYKGHDQ